MTLAILCLGLCGHAPVIDHHVLKGAPEPQVYHIHCDRGDLHHIKAEHGLPKAGVDISGRDPMTVSSQAPIAWFEIDGHRRKVRE